MNFIDMARLQRSQFFPSFEAPEGFKFVREKTMGTVQEQVEIVVILNDKTKQILRRRATQAKYVFGVIDDQMDEEDVKREVANWLRKTN